MKGENSKLSINKKNSSFCLMLILHLLFERPIFVHDSFIVSSFLNGVTAFF